MADAVDTSFEDWKDASDAPWHGSFPPKPGDYVLHATQGQGDCVVGGYPDLESALRDVKAHSTEASFGIEYPDGRWHQW